MADELNKPSRGTGDWDIPLNQNFDTLEAAARAFLPRGTTETLNVSDIDSASITNSNQIQTQSLNTDRRTIQNGTTLIGEQELNNVSQQTIDISLSQTYDQIRIFLVALFDTNGGDNILMRLNSNSNTVYNYVDKTGTQTLADDSITLYEGSFSTAALSGVITIDGAKAPPGSSTQRPTIDIQGAAPKSPAELTDYAYLSNNIGPINSIQFLTSGPGEARAVGRVLGVNR
jgi:hypothetical protein